MAENKQASLFSKRRLFVDSNRKHNRRDGNSSACKQAGRQRRVDVLGQLYSDCVWISARVHPSKIHHLTNTADTNEYFLY